ncbi:MAG: hypothetical protein MUP85_12340 [Candidatus Lokiarchaeota archaeon]|nr:hypothetical protein [Candidatus Lokiarchaeota archaeon]
MKGCWISWKLLSVLRSTLHVDVRLSNMMISFNNLIASSFVSANPEITK